MGRSPPADADGHSLNLATRRVPSLPRLEAPRQEGTTSRHRGSPLGPVGTPKQGSVRGQSEDGASCARDALATRPDNGTKQRTNQEEEPRKSPMKSNSRALCTDNDPSAGSPTETLLRLLLSPSDRVRASSRPTVPALARQTETNPRPSLNRSIDSSDGRCVQRAGT